LLELYGHNAIMLLILRISNISAKNRVRARPEF